MNSACRWFGILLCGTLVGDLPAAEPREIVPANAKLEKVAGDCKFTEGPAADADGNVFFTDGPNRRIMVCALTAKSKPGTAKAKMPTACALTPKAASWPAAAKTRWCRDPLSKKSGEPTILADRYREKRLTAPNDLCVDKKGRIYFTDPCYGKKPKDRQEKFAVYRIDAEKGEPIANKVTRIIDNVAMPNGIAISPDEKTLYVADKLPRCKGPAPVTGV